MNRFMIAAGISAILTLVACESSVDKGAKEYEHLERASSYLSGEQHRAALIELRGALRYNDQNAGTHWRVGELQARLGESREARLAFERAGRFGANADKVSVAIARTWMDGYKPNEALAALGPLEGEQVPAMRLLSAARAQLMLGNLDEAETLLGRIPAPRDEALYALRQAELAQQRGQPGEARRHVAAALAVDPKLIDAWLLQGTLQFENEEPQQAMDSFYQVVELSGRDSFSRRKVIAVRGIARAKVDLGLVNGAYRTYRELLGESRGKLFADYELGLDRYRKHDLEGAISSLENIYRDAPQHPPTLFLLGILSYEQGSLGKSVEYLEKLTAVDPDNVLAVKLLSAVHLEQQRPRAAAAVIRSMQHRKQAGEDAEVQVLLATALLRSGEQAAALQAIQQAAGLVDGDWAGEARVARLYLRAGEPDKAAALLQRTLTRGDYMEPVSALQATALVDAGRDDKAREHLAAWRKRDGDTPALRFATAVLEHRSGNAAQARVALQAMLTEHADHATARRYLAELQMANGERLAAVKNFVVLLSSESTESDAARRIARLLASGDGRASLRRDVLHGLEGALPAQQKLAVASAALGDWDSLEAIASQWRNGAPGDALALDYAATALQGLGHAEQVIELYQQFAPGDPLYLHAQTRLAAISLSQRELSEALAYADTALEINRDYLPALVIRAQGYLRDGALDRVQEHIDRIKNIPGGAARAYGLEGALWLARGDALAAAQSYQRNWEMREDRDSLLRYSEALLRAGLPSRGMPLQAAWLNTAPGDVLVRRVAASTALANDQKDVALSHYRSLLGLLPTDLVALNNIAWLYYERGDEQALDYAHRAYELAADNPDVADTYGWLLAEAGQVSEGERVLNKALQAHPDSKALREHLAAVRKH